MLIINKQFTSVPVVLSDSRLERSENLKNFFVCFILKVTLIWWLSVYKCLFEAPSEIIELSLFCLLVFYVSQWGHYHGDELIARHLVIHFELCETAEFLNHRFER